MTRYAGITFMKTCFESTLFWSLVSCCIQLVEPAGGAEEISFEKVLSSGRLLGRRTPIPKYESEAMNRKAENLALAQGTNAQPLRKSYPDTRFRIEWVSTDGNTMVIWQRDFQLNVDPKSGNPDPLGLKSYLYVPKPEPVGINVLRGVGNPGAISPVGGGPWHSGTARRSIKLLDVAFCTETRKGVVIFSQNTCINADVITIDSANTWRFEKPSLDDSRVIADDSGSEAIAKASSDCTTGEVKATIVCWEGKTVDIHLVDGKWIASPPPRKGQRLVEAR